MTVYTDSFTDEIVALVQKGGVGVLRTDTLYGLVARAADEAAVERVYSIKGRTSAKPPIVLVASPDQLMDTYDGSVLTRLKTLWPGKNSVILPAPTAPKWLVRSGDSLAYRMPDNKDLRDLLLATGPLIAPSANPEGEPPAADYNDAQEYFGDEVDFYVDQGRVIDNTPSKLYRLHDDTLERLR
jgi:L-threonylcarbamoyladenylate synthase